jgi:ABC-type lipoprotein export system ATPase subunit
VVKVRRLYLVKDRESMQPHIRAFVDRAVTFTRCGACGGARLNPAALSSEINGRNIAECSAMQISDLAEFVRGIDDPSVAPLVGTLRETLDSMVGIGLGYLSLDRESGTLSGGESQRVKMIRHLRSSLTDVTYVFDEPTIELHPHDIQRMNTLLLRLRDKGNTVLVVEHKPEVIEIADHVVDLGLGAGSAGGTVCYTGDVAGLRRSGTLTRRYVDHRARLRDRVRSPRGHLLITGANLHNLKNVSVDIPLGMLTVVTGVAGSGKSSLIHGSLSRRDGVLVVDQTAIRGSPPQQPRHLHRPARPHPHRLRQGQRHQGRPVQRELRGRLPEVQRPRPRLHRPGHDGRGGLGLRAVRGQAVHPRGAHLHAARQEHQPGPGHVGHRGPQLLSHRAGPRHPRPARRRGPGLPQPRPAADHPLRAASASASSWPSTWPARAAPTSSTSPPTACTSPMSTNSWPCSTGWSTTATRSSSSSTTRP